MYFILKPLMAINCASELFHRLLLHQHAGTTPTYQHEDEETALPVNLNAGAPFILVILTSLSAPPSTVFRALLLLLAFSSSVIVLSFMHQ